MRRRFFVDGFTGGSATLTGEAAHHLARVLRAGPGQLYELSDGECVWLAETESVGREEIHFLLKERIAVHTPPVSIVLLLAIVKFDRLEWAIEKATELGVDEIVPLIADRSEHGLIAAAPKRAERWRKILGESAQQSRRLKVPILGPAAKPGAAFAAESAAVRLLLSERPGAAPLRALLEPAAAQVSDAFIPSRSVAGINPARNSASITDNKASIPSQSGSAAASPARVAIAIGPEGGWTGAEFSAAASAGFCEAALGANILRTETAVCAALAAVQYAFGAFRPEGNTESAENEMRKENP
jgi:16S rRNA (uracil1498-N3)-methyltransferase